MNSEEIRKRFLEFFAKRGHAIVPSSSLIPDDPSVLLTTAGMQQFKPYFLGKADPMKDFGSRNTASIQKSFRTSDIDEVGDESHLTFFEMLGNFSFGSYFKEKAIQLAYDFLKEMRLPIDDVGIFEGDPEIPADSESERIWRELGVKDIRKMGRADNFWGPTGNEGPCGPTAEIYIRGTEIWNLVFNEYYCHPDKRLEKLAKNGIDTGMGLERLAMVIQKKPTIFETDLFQPLMELLPGELPARTKRIIADHIRGIAFLLADGLRPSNKEAGYALRRLMRRVMVYEKTHGLPPHLADSLLHEVIQQYGDFYGELARNTDDIRGEFRMEKERFDKTLEHGMKYFNVYARRKREGEPYAKGDDIAILSGKDMFDLYQNYGFPPEVTRELAEEYGMKIDEDGFLEELKKHQEISRAGQERKFGGHGLILDTGELKAADEAELKKVTRLHTATHLLNAALHKVLGDTVEQRGSDITTERTRFDFSFPRKVTSEELEKIEKLVGYAVGKDFPVTWREIPTEEAKRSGALYFYKGNYPPRVKVYTVGDDKEIFSRELCGGPHVSRTGEIGEFKIIKEESSSAGVRRIRAAVEP